jgi:hypothetical protein
VTFPSSTHLIPNFEWLPYELLVIFTLAVNCLNYAIFCFKLAHTAQAVIKLSAVARTEDLTRLKVILLARSFIFYIGTIPRIRPTC